MEDLDDATDREPTLGPALCHDCHGRLFFFSGIGWVERVVMGVVSGVPIHRFVWHQCTAASPLAMSPPVMRPR